jgi:hypothetical protein
VVRGAEDEGRQVVAIAKDVYVGSDVSKTELRMLMDKGTS